MPARVIERIRSLSWKQLAAGFFSLVAAAVLVATLASNWRSLADYEWQVNPWFLVASLLAYLVMLWLGASAWHSIVWRMDQRTGYRTGVKYFGQSQLAKRVPGLVWYALGRFYLYERDKVPRSVISVALALEMVTIIMGGIIVYLATFAAGAAPVQAFRLWWLILPASGLIVVMAWPESLFRLANALLALRGHAPLRHEVDRTDLMKWSLLHAAAWMAGGIFVVLLAIGVYPALGWSDVASVINSWAAAGLVSMVALVLPLGMGLREITLAYLLSFLVPLPVAVVISLLSRICSIIGDGVGLLIASRL